MTQATLTVTDPVILEFAQLVGTDDPVAVAGARTRWDVGGPLAEGSRIIEAPAGVVDYIPEEMVVTVRAGTPVAELAAVLAERGQRCALPDRGGTVGGAIAVGQNDLNVMGKGRLRNSVLQVRYVSAEGRVVTGGGPTVKNVTGFDLPRLMTGALGTLGLLGEVILRTNPTPARSQWFHSDHADPFAVLESVLKPSVVLWNGAETWVLLEGHPADVESEARALDRVAGFTLSDGPPELPPHRWSLSPAELRTFAIDHRSGNHLASIGVGTVFADQPQPPRAPDAVAQAVAQRIKHQFDPTGRLNPGRNPGA
jgi:glycolate oxidase FAD binding subunit